MASVGFRSTLCSCQSRASYPRERSGRLQLTFRIRFSAETGPAAAVEENSALPPPSESPVETRKSPSSLISSENVLKALQGIAITDVDHYGRLGIPRGTSYEQVKVAYEKMCEELMNKGLDEEETGKELELLKESYGILSSEEERRLYDWSLARSEKPDRYVWPFEVDITQIPRQPPPPQEPEDEGPTRLVGYFFLAWSQDAITDRFDNIQGTWVFLDFLLIFILILKCTRNRIG